MDTGPPLAVEKVAVVRVATLREHFLAASLQRLLELTFFSSSTDSSRFFSVSVTEEGTVTIVADAAELEASRSTMPGLDIDEMEWAVVRVGEGSDGFSSRGVVERMTEPLAMAGIPVSYLSTQATDYCLVPRGRLDDAMSCLSQTQQFSIEQLPPGEWIPMTVLEDRATSILRLDRQHLLRHTGALMRLLFMRQPGDSPQVFASLTETPDEISVVAGAAGDWWMDYLQTSDGLHKDTQEWVPIRVDVGDVPSEEADQSTDESDWDQQPGSTVAAISPGLRLVGFVAAQANVLASVKLPVFYACNVTSLFTFVHSDSVQRAAAAFEEAGFRFNGVEQQHAVAAPDGVFTIPL